MEVGVARLFGMPGGGRNADLIEAAGLAGLPFTLAHTETASAFMASAQAEITGKPGACLATLGPGAASIMNGVAYAHLEKVPLIVITDCQPDAAFPHQNLPQREMFATLVKFSGSAEIDEAIEAAMAFPRGPVHLNLSSAVTGAEAEKREKRDRGIANRPAGQPSKLDFKRPVLLAGSGRQGP